MHHSWEKLEGETDKAYSFFLMFADLPAHCRTFKELRNKTQADATKRKHIPGHWTGWRRQHNWDARARARDRHRLEKERGKLLSMQRDRLSKRLDAVDAMIESCEKVLFSQERLIQMVEKSPASLVSLFKILVRIQERTEVEMLGLNTLELRESPRELKRQELEDIAKVVALLQKQSESGNVTASKTLLELYEVNAS